MSCFLRTRNSLSPNWFIPITPACRIHAEEGEESLKTPKMTDVLWMLESRDLRRWRADEKRYIQQDAPHPAMRRFRSEPVRSMSWKLEHRIFALFRLVGHLLQSGLTLNDFSTWNTHFCGVTARDTRNRIRSPQ